MGVWSVQKALQLVLFRYQLHGKCSPTGRIAAIGITYRRCAEESEPWGHNIIVRSDTMHLMSTESNIFWRKLITTRTYHSREIGKKLRKRISNSRVKRTSESEQHTTLLNSNMQALSYLVNCFHSRALVEKNPANCSSRTCLKDYVR